jgi:hypothetical protein
MRSWLIASRLARLFRPPSLLLAHPRYPLHLSARSFDPLESEHSFTCSPLVACADASVARAIFGRRIKAAWAGGGCEKRDKERDPVPYDSEWDERVRLLCNQLQADLLPFSARSANDLAPQPYVDHSCTRLLASSFQLICPHMSGAGAPPARNVYIGDRLLQMLDLVEQESLRCDSPAFPPLASSTTTTVRER